jgi:hypothetical protein
VNGDIGTNNIMYFTGPGSYGALQFASSNDNAFFMYDSGQSARNGWFVGQSVTSIAGGKGFAIARTNTGTVSTNTGLYILSNGNVGIGRTDPTFLLDVNGTVRCGAITSSGTCTGVDFIATSDQRRKTNIMSISNALDIVKELRGVYFTRIGETKQTVGVIAQEVETVLPEVVHTDSEGLKSVSYGNMVGVLIEAVKVLLERVEKIEETK